jgi:hypothetical protein
MNIEEATPQPFFPRVRMIWFFIAATAVALAMGLIKAADQGQALAAALVFTAIFIALVFLFSAVCFFTAYMLGSMEKNLSDSRTVSSPFADGRMPEQILPPNPVETN